jgi:hypothetical protein
MSVEGLRSGGNPRDLVHCWGKYSMNERAKEVPWVNSNLFSENFNKLPAEEVWKYAGKFVGVSMDGTRILASGTDEVEMEQHLQEIGVDPSQVVGMFIPPPDMSVL